MSNDRARVQGCLPTADGRRLREALFGHQNTDVVPVTRLLARPQKQSPQEEMGICRDASQDFLNTRIICKQL